MPTLTIDTSALKHNIDLVQKLAKNAAVIAVLKNNGYGLGLLPFASVLQDRGICYFAVTDLSDAVALRNSGITGRILLLTPLYEFKDILTAMQNDMYYQHSLRPGSGRRRHILKPRCRSRPAVH